MNPNKKYSKKLRKNKNVEEILAGIEGCNRKIREDVQRILEGITEIGTEANKVNFILQELKNHSENPGKIGKLFSELRALRSEVARLP